MEKDIVWNIQETLRFKLVCIFQSAEESRAEWAIEKRNCWHDNVGNAFGRSDPRPAEDPRETRWKEGHRPSQDALIATFAQTPNNNNKIINKRFQYLLQIVRNDSKSLCFAHTSMLPLNSHLHFHLQRITFTPPCLFVVGQLSRSSFIIQMDRLYPTSLSAYLQITELLFYRKFISLIPSSRMECKSRIWCLIFCMESSRTMFGIIKLKKKEEFEFCFPNVRKLYLVRASPSSIFSILFYPSFDRFR